MHGRTNWRKRTSKKKHAWSCPAPSIADVRGQQRAALFAVPNGGGGNFASPDGPDAAIVADKFHQLPLVFENKWQPTNQIGLT
jgi:hypothetical protein